MKSKKILYYISGIIMLLIAAVYILWRTFFGLNMIADADTKTFYIPTGSRYQQVLDTIYSNFKVRNHHVFEFVANKKNYSEHIKPGRYEIETGQSYVRFINKLRTGRQKPVRITFNNVRTLNQIAGKIGRKIETDSLEILNFLTYEANYSSDGFRSENIISVFIPDTYEIYWNTSARELYERMLKEYRKFWNDERVAKAKEKNLSQSEVSILASIIDDEVVKKDEKPRIAGVYLNRIKQGIPLQACPTIKFALNDFTITRVLKVHLSVDSPYNTYKHNGFPPGPIGCPSIDGIDAVLNAEKHDYLYFAAKADFSGYHNFSRTLSEHNRYAAMYQKELNRRKIFK